MIVGALIFVLGIDLAKEALYDTVGRVNGWEYLTIWVIVIVMTYWDFVIGILAGIIIACCFFVVQTSRRKTVRAIFDGSVARSTVRRHMIQRHFLDEVGTQTQIIKLQGFLFFGTINSVEDLIRRALDIAAWNQNPIRFLYCRLYARQWGGLFGRRGVPAHQPAAHGKGRSPRLLRPQPGQRRRGGVAERRSMGGPERESRGIRQPQRGFGVDRERVPARHVRVEPHGGESVRSGIHGGRGRTDGSRSKAEACIRARSLLRELAPAAPSARGGQDGGSERAHDAHLGDECVRRQGRAGGAQTTRKPRATLPAAHDHLPRLPRADDTSRSGRIVLPLPRPYFTLIRKNRGDLLWSRGEPADAVYLIESGIIKARYDFPQEQYEINEAMLAGTIAGELTFLSRKERNTTAYADTDVKLWMLDQAGLERMEREVKGEYRRFVEMLLRVAGDEQESLMSYLVSRLS